MTTLLQSSVMSSNSVSDTWPSSSSLLCKQGYGCIVSHVINCLMNLRLRLRGRHIDRLVLWRLALFVLLTGCKFELELSKDKGAKGRSAPSIKKLLQDHHILITMIKDYANKGQKERFKHCIQNFRVNTSKKNLKYFFFFLFTISKSVPNNNLYFVTKRQLLNKFR